MPQAPGMGIQEKYGGSVKGKGKANQGGGGTLEKRDRSMMLLAQNYDPELGLEFPDQPHLANNPNTYLEDNLDSYVDSKMNNESFDNFMRTFPDWDQTVTSQFVNSEEGQAAADYLSLGLKQEAEALYNKFKNKMNTIPDMNQAGGTFGDIPR